MQLKDILKNIKCVVYGDEEVEIDNLSHNSKEVKDNGLFFAIRGEKVNGENFAIEAVNNGAKVVLSETRIDLKNITNVVVSDARKAMSECSANYYLHPAEKMLIIGVTGTNGKTTTTYMLKSIFEKAGKKVGVIGTNGIVIDNKKIGSDFTTPDPILLQKTLAEMSEKGINVVCMEISAHALKLQKIWGVMSDIALFTNLTQDHLDFFENMQSYFEAKKTLFSKEHARFGIINIDDPYGRKIFEDAEIPIITISREKNNVDFSQADIFAIGEKHNISSQEFDVDSMQGEFHIKLNMLGGFNVSNALGAIAVAIMTGVDKETIQKAFEELKKVDGRFNSYLVSGARVIVDYAHTPDGLENILKAAKEITNGKLISVFGCGGDRDKTKRPLMGEISSRLADMTVLTSDNSRSEKTLEIIKDIETGFRDKNYVIEEDRISAIKRAINLAKHEDTVVILGKGVEKYFDINGKKIPYIGDCEVIEEIKKEHARKIEIESILL